MPRHRRARWRLPAVPFVIALTCFLGVLVLLYPTAASWFSEYAQAGVIDELTAVTGTVRSSERTAQLLEAQQYNEQLFGTALVGANERLPLADSSQVAADYSEQLAADSNGLMARITVPSVGIDLPIYHGTSDAVLDRGVGHLEGTALPVGGAGTHSVLTGHRGLATAELFTRLNEVAIGDSITIEVLGEVLAYRVTDTQVVEPEETQTLYPVAGRDLITLVTCTPLGINSHRILVTAERVLPTPPAALADSGARAPGPGFPWWALAAAASILLLAVYVRWAGRSPQQFSGERRKRDALVSSLSERGVL